MEARLTLKQAKNAQRLIQEIENLHPSIKRKIYEKICEIFENVINVRVEGVDPINKGKKLIIFVIYQHDQVGYLALDFCIKYYKTTLDFDS